MKNKLYYKLMSQEGAKEERALNFSKRMTGAMDTAIRVEENKVLELEGKLQDLSDFGPESTVDLTVGKGIDTTQRAADIKDIVMKLTAANIKIENLRAYYEENYGEVKDGKK